MAPRPPLVALKNVRLQDGQRPLFDGVDIAVEPRTRAALVGRNGAGKSTLMKMVMGLIEPDAGDRSMQAGTRFAYVAQEPDITGETLLDYAASGGAERWTAEAWLATFGLDPEKAAVNLSGGENRRAALAKQNDRPKNAVNRAAHNQLLRVLAFDHGLHRKTLKTRRRVLAQHPRQHHLGGLAHFRLVL